MRSLTVLFFALLAGCQSTRIAMSEKWDHRNQPSYVDYFDYYWWGFSGDNSVSMQKACVDQRPLGFERVQTVEDIMITAVTLGLYTPVTVKIWCGE
jgi:hypothetical protein